MFSALSIIFVFSIIWMFARFLFVGIKAAWSLAQFMFAIVFVPAILVGMFVSGLVYAAVALGLVFAVISLLIR